MMWKRTMPFLCNRPRLIFVVLLLFFVIFSVYFRTFDVPFQFDDLGHIVDNSAIQTLDIRKIFDYSKSRFLLYLSFALNDRFRGDKVFAFHLTNIVLHVLNSLWVFLISFWTYHASAFKDAGDTKRVFPSALFSSLIFAVHPLQTESVTYIYQRGESLTAFFYFSALFFYLQSRTRMRAAQGAEFSNASLKKLPYFLCVVLASCCFFTKPHSVTLPFAILFYEVYFFSKTGGETKSRLRYILPFFFLAIIPFILAKMDFSESQNIGVIWDAAHAPYYLTKARVLTTALRLMILPIGQNLDYDFPLSTSFISPMTTLFSFIFLVMLLSAGFATRRRFPIISFGIIWFFLTLSVTTLLYLDDLFFEHYLYLTLFGYALAVPAVSLAFFKRFGFDARIGMTGLLVLVLWFAAAAHQRNEIWRSEIALWEDAVKKSPNKARPHYILGVYYFKKAKYDEALRCYRRALEINPDYAEAFYRLGEFYHTHGDLKQSVFYLRKAIELKPDFYEARINLAAAYSGLRNFLASRAEAFAVLKAKPGDAHAYFILGASCLGLGDFEEAKDYLTKGLAFSTDQDLSRRISGLLKKAFGS